MSLCSSPPPTPPAGVRTCETGESTTPQVRVLHPPARPAVSPSADLLADGSILVCGGEDTGATSCERLEPGSSGWVHHADTSMRDSHSSWTAPSGDVILMGGYYNVRAVLDTTEVVGRGSSFTLARPAQ